MDKKQLISIFFLFLIIIILLIVFWILKRRNKQQSVESFTDYQYVSNPNNLNSELELELIKYGNFEQQQHIFNSQVGSGYKIISFPNPGTSSYVLQQSTLINSCSNQNYDYKIKLYLDKSKFYRFRYWICLSDDWNGTNNIFTIKIFNQNNYRLIKNEGKIIDNVKIYNLQWTLYEYILELDTYETGEINWFLGYQSNNSLGYRYFTGISITAFNPMLHDFKIINGLQCFLNVNNKLSFNKSSLIWKDLSNQGRDFKFSTLPVMEDSYSFTTLNSSIIGPYCNQLGIKNQQNITILWYSKFNSTSQNQYHQTKNDSCSYQLFNIYTDCSRYPYLTVYFNFNDNCIYISCKNFEPLESTLYNYVILNKKVTRVTTRDSRIKSSEDDKSEKEESTNNSKSDSTKN